MARVSCVKKTLASIWSVCSRLAKRSMVLLTTARCWLHTDVCSIALRRFVTASAWLPVWDPAGMLWQRRLAVPTIKKLLSVWMRLKIEHKY